MMRITLLILVLAGLFSCSSVRSGRASHVVPGAERTSQYLPLLAGKQVALVANQTSLIGNEHLADSLVSLGVRISCIFSPEHGFRGNSDAGQYVENSIDEKTGIPVISLYGGHRKPRSEDLSGVDIVVFDIQDVGVRFYTYISTLHYVMESCAENGKPLIVLDRPDPNGNYTDGPILDAEYRSFVGLDPVPVVYGMTIGEYARMVNGEGWLDDSLSCRLTIITCLQYDHSTRYSPPVPPSPNLPDIRSVLLYPSLAFFEGTSVSVGRGTPFPFQVFGSPDMTAGDFYFTPRSIPGAALRPMYEGEKCRGTDLRTFVPVSGRWERLDLQWIRWAYRHCGNKDGFFNSYFNTLAGTSDLRKQIEAGMTDEEIRKSWEPGLEKFRAIREKYLLYE